MEIGKQIYHNQFGWDEQYTPKQELIPLDVNQCFLEIRNKLLNTWLKLDNTREEFIKQILSKYGTTPQKKFTRDEVLERVEANSQDLDDMGEKQIIKHFLQNHWLLED